MHLRRLPLLLLLLAFIGPGLVVFPVVSAPAAQPHPVAPLVQHLHLGAGATVHETGSGRGARLAVRTPALTAADSVAPFRLVGVTWSGATPAGLTVSVRTRTQGVWSGWEPLTVSDDAPDPDTAEGKAARSSTEPLLSPGSDGVQLRAETSAGVVPQDLRLELIDPGSSAADGTMQGTPAPASSAAAASSTPTIISRAQWGADESIAEPTHLTGPLQVGFVHHTASSNSYWSRAGWTMADAARDIRAIYAYHVKSLGWADIGYNFLVDQAGRIYEGRHGGITQPVMGAHTGGFNTNTFGVAALGNLDTASPSSAMLTGIARIMAWKLDLYHRDPLSTATLTSGGYPTARYAAGAKVTVHRISGHRDVDYTACPGKYLYAQLASIRSQARAFQGAALYDPSVSATSGVVGSRVTVRARVPGAQTWRLTVTAECSGVTVATLNGSVSAAGPLAATWDGTTGGKPAPPGRYLLLLQSFRTGSTARSVAYHYEELTAAGAELVCPQVDRLSGPDRYATSVAIGRVAQPSATTVVLASGDQSHLVDGLVAGPLARSLKAPVLLATPSGLPSSVAADIRARKVTTAYLVGGVQSLGAAVSTQLAALGVTNVKRLDGTDRYGTAAAVAAQMGPHASAIIASGQAGHLVDALAASGPAAATGRPILLTTRSTLPTATADALTSLGVTSTLVLGGTDTVGPTVFAAVPAPVRLSGADRYQTASAVATAFVGKVPVGSVVVASGVDANMVDALPGGALGQLMLLSSTTRLPAASVSFLQAHPVRSGTLLGGSDAVSDAVLLTVSREVTA